MTKRPTGQRAPNAVRDLVDADRELALLRELIQAASSGPGVEPLAAAAARMITAATGTDVCFVHVLDDIGTIDLGRDPLDLGAPLSDLRVFVGYAGWAPGQLEGELDQGAWFVVDLEHGDPFVPAPERLWRDVLRRQPGRLAMFANYPEDAGTN